MGTVQLCLMDSDHLNLILPPLPTHIAFPSNLHHQTTDHLDCVALSPSGAKYSHLKYSLAQAWPAYLFLNMSGVEDLERGNLDHPLIWIATAHPLTRLPVFLMGVAAGLVRLRGEDDFNLGRNFLHCLLPWGLDKHLPSKSDEEGREKSWRWRVDLGALALLSFVLLCKTLTDLEKQHSVIMVVPTERVGLVYIQLMLMVGLTADGGKSILSRIFR